MLQTYIINILMSNNIVHTLYTRIIGNRCGEAVLGLTSRGDWQRGCLYSIWLQCCAASLPPEDSVACRATHKVLTR